MPIVSRAAVLALLVSACASEPTENPLDDYVEVKAATILDAPSVDPSTVSLQDRHAIVRGEYMVELLGCGTCHTPGALQGSPNHGAALSGSKTGIAYTSPLAGRYPGVVFPSNITPDDETGIGNRTDEELDDVLRAGISRHGRQAAPVMPWPGYARLSDEDAAAIIAYLRNLEPIRHRVPNTVKPGTRTSESFVYFGFYTNKE